MASRLRGSAGSGSRGGAVAELYVEVREAETLQLDGGRVAELRHDRDVGGGVCFTGR